MAITVLEAMKLNSLKNFHIVAGQSGIHNLIEKVGILDYEFINNMKNQFKKGDFVISSFLFAKDNEDIFVESIKSLIEEGTSCLGIKDVYYKKLPKHLIEYANKKSFPIFFFDNSVFFEDIITEVTQTIHEIDNNQLMEMKIDMLIKKDINKSVVRELALEINSLFKEKFIVIYCKRKETLDDNLYRILEYIKKDVSFEIHNSILKYRNGLLIILTFDQLHESSLKNTAMNFISEIGVSTNDYFIGISNTFFYLNELNNGIKESLYACNKSKIEKNNIAFFKDIGIYKFIMPHIDEFWINEFYKDIKNPINDYDKKNNGEIFNTLIAYVKNNGNIKSTADSLFQHENTIRYRINKAREILNMADLGMEFQESISVAIKIYMLYSENN